MSHQLTWSRQGGGREALASLLSSSHVVHLFINRLRCKLHAKRFKPGPFWLTTAPPCHSQVHDVVLRTTDAIGPSQVTVLFVSVCLWSSYLVPESLPVQGDDDHGGVGQEALVVEGQVSPLPRHVQHVPAAQRTRRGKGLSHVIKGTSTSHRNLHIHVQR